MATAMKGKSTRHPLAEMQSAAGAGAGAPDDFTVEQFLTQQFETIIADLQQHTASLVTKLRSEYTNGVSSIKDLMSSSSSSTTGKRLCVMLRCNTGAHAGQKFRLETNSTSEEENIFKIGRSTGRQFKEKGVSLYKDKEISTTHAIIEIKFGQAFFTDVGSTNGSLLNDAEIERKVPIRLQDNDVLMLGGSELHVTVTDLDDEENGIVSV